MKPLKIIISIFFILLLSGTALIFFHFKVTEAAPPVYSMAGWLWTETFGWISLNSENPELAEYHSSVSYKVEIQNNEISGWGWSSNLGWICFGKTCDPNQICDLNPSCSVSDAINGLFGSAIPGIGWQAKIDPNSGKISGYAKVLALKDAGIIRFDSPTTVNPNQSGKQCFDCQKKCIEWEQISNSSNEEAVINEDKCIQFSEIEFDDCKFCFTRTYFGVPNEDGQAYPNDAPKNEAVKGGSGNICFNCSVCQANTSFVNPNLVRNSCAVCNECKYFGSALDSSSGALVGWAWSSGGDKDEIANVGWIQINTGWAGIVYPWLETQFGSVYSSLNIRQKSSVSGKNATYCIFAKDVYNFTSSQCQKNFDNVDISYLTKLSDDNSLVYKNALGKIDIKGLSTIVSDNNQNKYNKFGNKVVVINGNNITWDGSTSLSNQVYIINGDLNIANGFSINNDGSGTVIVNGNLLISDDFGYNANFSSNNMKDLGSIAWVVMGDIVVQPQVTKIAGAFVVLGKDNQPLIKIEPKNKDYPKFEQNKHGIFFSGSSDKPLTVIGLIFARAFGWERTYSNIKQGSERIIYDGRLIANPPPGLQGFAEGLPIIRDFEF